MKAPITREELKRRLMERGGISPDDAENAAVMDLFDEIDRLRSGEPKQQRKTVRAVIKVAVDQTETLAVGEENFKWLLEPRAYYTITADLPIPEEVTVEAEVKNA